MSAKWMRRKIEVLAALDQLGGEASTRAIAYRVDRPVNGVAQTLGSCRELVGDNGRGGERIWKRRDPTCGAGPGDYCMDVAKCAGRCMR